MSSGARQVLLIGLHNLLNLCLLFFTNNFKVNSMNLQDLDVVLKVG